MREPTMIAAVGMPGVGKTFENLHQIVKVYRGNPVKGVVGRKILIIDNNNEYNNDNKDVRAILAKAHIRIKTIHPNQVSRFSASRFIEVCRVIPFNDDGRPMSLPEFGETLNKVLNNFRNGLLIAEDFKAYTGNSLNTELIGKLATRRHSGCDTLMSLQGMGMIVPTLWDNLKWLRLHRSLDSISRGGSKEKFKGQIHFLSIAEKIVEKKYMTTDERFFVNIDLMRGIIYGKYSRADFEDAAEKYMYENWSKTAGLLLQHRNRESGQKIYTDQTAITAFLQQLVNDFSQFSERAKK